MAIEVDGLLWEPGPGATASAEEFARARSLILGIHEEMRWNPWVWQDRAVDHGVALDVFVEWGGAEPGFRTRTVEEINAEREQRLAGINAEAAQAGAGPGRARLLL